MFSCLLGKSLCEQLLREEIAIRSAAVGTHLGGIRLSEEFEEQRRPMDVESGDGWEDAGQSPRTGTWSRERRGCRLKQVRELLGAMGGQQARSARELGAAGCAETGGP